MTFLTEEYTGASCTGSDGDQNRILTLNNSRMTLDAGLGVYASGLFLYNGDDFTINHAVQYTTITFLNHIFNDMQITVVYDTAGSTGIQGQGAAGIIPLDTQIFINEIDYLGDTVTVKIITDSSYSKWGDATESTTNVTGVKAVVNDITPEELKNMDAIFQGAEKRFFFKNIQGNIANGNRIAFNSITYEIVRVFNHTMAGNTYMLEAWGKRT